MIVDEFSIGVCVGIICMGVCLVSMELGLWLASRGPKPQLTPEDIAKCQRWLDMQMQARIPPGTTPHRFYEIPGHDLLTNREGHPYT